MGERDIGADDVRDVVAAGIAALRPGHDRDWSVPAGDLDRDCWETVEHTADVCARVLARLMPDVEIAEAGAWQTLRWATGRTDLPGRPHRDHWRWHNE